MSDFVRRRLNMKRRVLIVDDEEINRLILQNILEPDYEVVLASNGKEALDVVKEEGNRFKDRYIDLLVEN